MERLISRTSRATLAALLVHYLCFYIWGIPLWTDTIAQWIMAHTPNSSALWLLSALGVWAKPFAMTGGLATLGFGVLVSQYFGPLSVLPVALAYSWLFGYTSIPGSLTFWLPALVGHAPGLRHTLSRQRREFLVTASATAAVALESYLRDRHLSQRAATPIDIAAFTPPPDTFAPGLVRKNVTPTSEFYGMSKNTVDPTPDPRTWRLRITIDNKLVRHLTYPDLLALPRASTYSTMRCVSNTLKSDLMGTAHWTGIALRQLIDPASLPPSIAEVAIVGVDGHGDSLPPDLAFSNAALLALGMNGKSLDRTHGFPLRLIVPRYYGFKNVKWIGEIAFVTRPYFGTWPRMGYTKEPVVHTGCHIDRIVRDGSGIRVGGIAFAGDRGIRTVQVRVDNGPWMDVKLEEPLSPFTWRRWVASIPARAPEPGAWLQARAMDGAGVWQSDTETPLFPAGVNGPTIRKVT